MLSHHVVGPVATLAEFRPSPFRLSLVRRRRWRPQRKADTTHRRSTAEAPEEEPTFSEDRFSVLQCNISGTTNEMTSGILDVSGLASAPTRSC
jgi:hypothetical protein